MTDQASAQADPEWLELIGEACDWLAGPLGQLLLEEERRLFYVALTRARELLYLTWSRKRRIYGRREARELSPFVGDIERQLLKHQAPHLSVTRKTQQVQLKLF